MSNGEILVEYHEDERQCYRGQKVLTFEPANRGSPQSFSKMTYEIIKFCMRSDGITGNTRTVTVVVQFAKIEHYSTTFQRHIRL